jgi:hypothetical protein
VTFTAAASITAPTRIAFAATGVTFTGAGSITTPGIVDYITTWLEFAPDAGVFANSTAASVFRVGPSHATFDDPEPVLA